MSASRAYFWFRILVVALTLFALLGHYYLPKKTWLVVPNDANQVGLGSDSESGGLSRAQFVSEDKYSSLCKYRISSLEYSYCGVTFSLGSGIDDGRDFSSFYSLRVHLNYRGPAKRMRMFMRNYNPVFSNTEDQNTSKFLSLLLRTQDLDEPIDILLSGFTVADWWLANLNLPRELSGPNFDNVTVLGFDYLDEGDHFLDVERIEFVGNWIDTEKLLLGIIFCWVLLILVESFIRLYVLHKKNKYSNQLLHELAGNYSRLEIEKQAVEDRSKRDALTGLYNRFGLMTEVSKLFSNSEQKINTSLILIDVDHFKRINDTRGHDIGDAVLSALGNILLQSVRQGDYLARWGGEEFVLVCKETSYENALRTAEKLRDRVARQAFALGDGRLVVNISLGVATVKEDDSFETALKRADEALYLAKASGRNCVMSELDIAR